MRLAAVALAVSGSALHAQTGLDVLDNKTCDTALAYIDGANPLDLSPEAAEQVRREIFAYFVGVADASVMPGVPSSANLEIWRFLCLGVDESARGVIRPQ